VPKKPLQISCAEADRQALEQLAFSRAESRAIAERAQMVLGCLDGKQISEIAQAFRTRPNTVIKWRDRFAHQGLTGLRDAPRPGPTPVYGAAFRKRVLALLETAPPAALAGWDGTSVAALLKCPPHAVWRVLRKEGICLRRQRSWRVVTDRQFEPKAIELVGLHLDPPFNALAIGVGRWPGASASPARPGCVLTDNGKIARRLKSVARRQGSLSLCDALRVGAGQGPAALTETHRRAEFLAFLEQIVAETPADRQIHLLLEHGFSFQPNPAWLARHAGRMVCHFTPPSVGWLQQVEIWLSLLSGSTAADAGPAGAAELRQAIVDFTTARGPKAKPFRWCLGEVNQL
jgi:transposase